MSHDAAAANDDDAMDIVIDRNTIGGDEDAVMYTNEMMPPAAASAATPSVSAPAPDGPAVPEEPVVHGPPATPLQSAAFVYEPGKEYPDSMVITGPGRVAVTMATLKHALGRGYLYPSLALNIRGVHQCSSVHCPSTANATPPGTPDAPAAPAPKRLECQECGLFYCSLGCQRVMWNEDAAAPFPAHREACARLSDLVEFRKYMLHLASATVFNPVRIQSEMCMLGALSFCAGYPPKEVPPGYPAFPPVGPNEKPSADQMLYEVTSSDQSYRLPDAYIARMSILGFNVPDIEAALKGSSVLHGDRDNIAAPLAMMLLGTITMAHYITPDLFGRLCGMNTGLFLAARKEMNSMPHLFIDLPMHSFGVRIRTRSVAEVRAADKEQGLSNCFYVIHLIERPANPSDSRNAGYDLSVLLQCNKPTPSKRPGGRVKSRGGQIVQCLKGAYTLTEWLLKDVRKIDCTQPSSGIMTPAQVGAYIADLMKLADESITPVRRWVIFQRLWALRSATSQSVFKDMKDTESPTFSFPLFRFIAARYAMDV